ncbi:MAG: helix-turn-helix domain-containing protein, partial [Culicoidibacterales bacterium]
MNMIRIDKKNPVISIPNAIIRTTQLNAEEKMLYLVLYDLTNNSIELQAFPTKAYLMERIGVKSNKTLIKYLQNLEVLKLVKVIREKTSNGMNASNVYIVQST